MDAPTAGGYLVSADPNRFDLSRAFHWISAESYWGTGLPQATFARAVAGSLSLGVYAPAGQMVGMARVVTDRATFGWICDVYIDADHRGAGLGKAMMDFITGHPDLQGLRRLHLATRDAHGLYAQYGFVPLTGADRWMEIRKAYV